MKYDFQKKKFIETERLAEKIAVAGSDKDMNWATLQLHVENLSAQFKTLCIPPGHPVIIYGHKECLFPVVMLACMQAGIPYIPIDKIYPEDRIKKIMTSTGSQVLINCTNESFDTTIAIVINTKLESQINHAPCYENRIYGDVADPLAYIMFTSGSTGEPKGVQINYSSVLAFIDWALNDFGFSEQDVFMNQAPFTFDVSLCDVLNAFAHGGTLVLNSTAVVKDQDAFINRLIHYKCSVWTSTPSFGYLFLRHADFNSNHLPSLSAFLFMGEELPNRTAVILRTNFKNARVLNAYGPTEATIVTTFIHLTDELIKKYPSLPIGFPMPGSELLVEKEQAPDKAGELIIAGTHVSAGYFKNETANKQKFFEHNGKRAFRTGDMAYYEDGMLFFLGRNDDQVKMHGYRIELAEISSVICKHAAVADAVTIALKRNNEVKKIISFIIVKYVIEKNELLKQLQSFLETTLPYYMIPGDIAVVKNFPYSVSHKIDKNKLMEDYLNIQFTDHS